MFNPTKAHEKWIKENQYKIRIGNRVPNGAVSLAYAHVTPMNSKQNIQIADTSGFILENIAAASTSEKLMWPNDAYLLEDESGRSIVSSRNFLITNVFDNEQPLYYMYETKFDTIDSIGPDTFGFYQGHSILLVDRAGQKLGSAYGHKIMLVPTGEEGRYRIRVFTNFQTQPSDTIKVVYTAIKEEGAVPGYSELITPQPAFEKGKDISSVANDKATNSLYYQMNGRELGQSRLSVSQVPLKNSQYRSPVSFTYTISAFYTDGTSYTTPPLLDNVYHEDSVTEADEFYHNGFKRLQGKTAEELLLEYSAAHATKSVDYFAVQSSNADVELYTQPDGQNYVIASTQKETGQIILPPSYRIEERNGDTYYAPTYSIKLIGDNQIRVVEPIQTEAHESWYLRVKNGRFDREGSNTAGFPIKYRYTVPEYYTQPFDSELGMPYRLVKQERPIVAGERKIKVRYGPLYVKTSETGYNIKVVVNGVSAVVKGWDTLGRTIDIDTKVKENDKIFVDYYYEEETFMYRGYWDEENQRFWGLDINPSHGHMYTDINKESGEIVDVPSFGLINKTVYIYLKPNAVISENDIIVKGSYEANTIFHTFEELVDTDAILLAKVRIRPNSSIDSVKLVDTRIRGGGLKESIGRELMKELNPDSEYYWDVGYWDGEPYSENGVVVIRLPKHILQENGGRFTLSEVEAIAKRHLGYGNLPLIEFVEEPVRLIGTPFNTSVDVIISGE